MKRILSFLLAICMLLTLCACGDKSKAADAPASSVGSAAPTAKPAPSEAAPVSKGAAETAPNAAEQEVLDVDAQLGIIFDLSRIWDRSDEETSEYEQFSYAVTDLDHNGRLEIISAITLGTGIYTTGAVYELSADYNTLVRCDDRDGEMQFMPELIVYSTRCFTDRENGDIYYIFNDNTKVGAAEFYNSVEAVSLKDGKLSITQLASCADIYTNGVGSKTFKAADGAAISEDEYKSIADSSFAGLDEDTAHFGWFKLSSGNTAELLTMSRQVFAGELDSVPLFETENSFDDGDMNAYAAVLDRYFNALEALDKITPEVAERFGISEMVVYSKGVGYAYEDLDSDGTPELIIAGVDYYLSDETMIYEIAALKDGEAVTLCRTSARNRYYLCGDKRVLNVGSGGAAYTTYTLLECSGAELNAVVVLESDLDADAKPYWRYIDHSVTDAESGLGYDEGLALAAELEALTYVPQLTTLH